MKWKKSWRNMRVCDKQWAHQFEVRCRSPNGQYYWPVKSIDVSNGVFFLLYCSQARSVARTPCDGCRFFFQSRASIRKVRVWSLCALWSKRRKKPYGPGHVDLGLEMGITKEAKEQNVSCGVKKDRINSRLRLNNNNNHVIYFLESRKGLIKIKTKMLSFV